MADRPAPLTAWHAIVASKDQPGYDSDAALDALLAEDVVFKSPAVFKPQEGKAITKVYLGAALVTLGPTLRYVDEWVSDTGAVLEFEAPLDGILAHGIDMMRWNEAGLLTSFTVMIRPMRGLQKVVELMAAELARVLG